jgi:hypothetical protein
MTMTMFLFGGLLLLFLGALLGGSWATQLAQPKLRRQAEERRRLNEQWAALPTVQSQRRKCPRCSLQLSEWDWYLPFIASEERPDDDDCLV